MLIKFNDNFIDLILKLDSFDKKIMKKSSVRKIEPHRE